MRFEDEIKQQKFGSTGQKAFLNVVFTSNFLQGFVKDKLKPYGLTLQQYNVLRILRGRYPSCAYPTDIKDVMLDKNPDLTRLCDRMVVNGWITREIDDKNRRKVKVSITEKGLALLASLDGIMEDVQRKMDFLTDAENTTLSDLLDKMRG